ncbi:MAG TPA: fibrobacter succinogenes major paralogous domain-containing protein [Bacteroidia bacterium]|nr:fibrobacter succinogenes major paralogous domain-containing protein [Bacteroidia bacterium]
MKERIPVLIKTCALLFIMLVCSCKKKTEAPAVVTGTVTDIDNNVYPTVQIGNQWWMAQDLRVSRYRNGSPVQHIETDTVWAKQKKGAYCGTLAGYHDTVSKFYNWYAISDTTNILAPAGWHIPSDDEWKQLEEYLGMSSADADLVNWRGTHNEGDKLKKTITSISVPGDWKETSNIYTVWPTNESGFNAFAYSCRMFDGTQPDYGLSYTGFWWSSSNNVTHNQAWYRYLDYKNANIFRFYGPKTYGFSVRCVRDSL